MAMYLNERGFLMLAIAPNPAVVNVTRKNPRRITFLAPNEFLMRPLNGEKIIYATENTAIIKLVSLGSNE